jgi:uncharacterized protein
LKGSFLLAAENVLLLAFAIGFAFGGVGQASGFCLMSGLRGWWGKGGDTRKIRTFALAAGVAVLASQAIDAAGYIDLRRSLYVMPSFSIPVIAVGGALFGYGMILANGCGARALVLLGRGNLRSFVVLLTLGIAAQMTLTGLLAPSRVSLSGQGVASATPTLAGVVSGWAIDPSLARWVAVAAIAGLLIAFAFLHRPFRSSPLQILAGLIIGLLVAAGWYVTGHIGADDFDPVPLASLTFIAPMAGAIQYVMLSTGTALSFGVAVVGGVVLGGAVVAVATRTFQLEGFSNARALLRYMAGGALMGVGGALAFGCSIGQGLTGLSTMALASLVAVGGILLGAGLGIRGPLKLAPPLP